MVYHTLGVFFGPILRILLALIVHDVIIAVMFELENTPSSLFETNNHFPCSFQETAPDGHGGDETFARMRYE